MNADFKGKNVAVTGSSRGIGLAIAETFASLGAHVLLNCNVSVGELETAETRLKSRGASVLAFAGDVSDYSVCRRIFGEFEDSFGGVDILVNNAAIAHYELFTDVSPDEWRKITETNVYSVFNCTHLALPHMIRQKSGAIVNISSVWGVSGASCEAVYSASKGAVNAFTKAIAREVAPSNVFVNAIACGVIDTKMNDRLTGEERSAIIDSIGVMRLGTPKDVAELCVYLTATKYMTGQVLSLDGGFC